MPVPDYETMMRPFLAAIEAGAKNVAEAIPILKANFSISDEEAEELLPSGRISILASRAHWARTYLANAGCLISPKRNVHMIQTQCPHDYGTRARPIKGKYGKNRQ